MSENQHLAHCHYCFRTVQLDAAEIIRVGYGALFGLIGVYCLRCGNPGKVQIVQGPGISGRPWSPPPPPPPPPDIQMLRAGIDWVPECRWPPVPPWVTEGETRWEYGTVCGRFAFFSPLDLARQMFGFRGSPNIEPRWNIGPLQKVAVVRQIGGERRIDLLQWGLVPWWAKDIRIAATMINVRPDWLPHHLTRLPAPVDQRCLVLADGFYEWHAEGVMKEAYYFSRKDGSIFAFAGFWARNTIATGAAIESCAVAVVSPMDDAGDAHPLVAASLTSAQSELWLDPNCTVEQLRACLQGVEPNLFQGWPVALQVSSPTINEPDCITPIGVAESALEVMRRGDAGSRQLRRGAQPAAK